MEALILENISKYEQERNKPMPSKLHSVVQYNLSYQLGVYLSKFDICPELSLEFVEGTLVPDLSLFPKGVLSFAEDEIRVSIAPTLAIEILSPTQSLQELLIKSQKYFQYGVLSYWLVIPPLRCIHVFSSPQDYEMYKHKDTLIDNQTNIALDLTKIFPK